MKKIFLFALLLQVIVACDQPVLNPPSADEDDSHKTESYIVTGGATDITFQSVTLYGEVHLGIGKYESIEWGIMYSIDTTELASRKGKVVYCTDTLLENVYSVSIKDLVAETKYYYCGFVYLNNNQYEFGEIREFTTLSVNINVLTGSAEEITHKSAVLHGELEAKLSDYTSVKYGISYSTNRSNLTSNNGTLVYCSASLQDNSYSVALSGLKEKTKYYYCAFVYVNERDYKYGGINSFTTLEIPEPIQGVFEVSETRQVIFSSGNLQYHPANDEWRFAESQWDYIGEANNNISSTYNGWLDLFCWSTASTYFGVSTSQHYRDYYGSFVDWGTNQIGNDAPNTWRTLTRAEWDYLLSERRNFAKLRGVAQVNGVNGLIFLPNNWICPEDVIFKSGFQSVSSGSEGYTYQTFTTDQWARLEEAGAVFLPAAGERSGSVHRGGRGNYWSCSTYYDDAFYFGFGATEASANDYIFFYRGYSVRLVKDL